MGPLAIGLLLGIGWLAWSGRLKRMGRNDALAGAVAILGLALAGHGRVGAGGMILAGAIAYLLLRPGSVFARPRVRSDTERKGGSPPSDAPPSDAPVRDARALLGLTPDAGEGEIRAAHRRLIGLAHPDRGGTAALSAQINDARDTLLAHLKSAPRVHPS